MPFSLYPILVLVATALTVIPGLKTIARAEKDLNQTPSCALDTVVYFLYGFQCDSDSYQCLCASNGVMPKILRAVEEECDMDELQAVRAVLIKFCPNINHDKTTTTATARPGALATPLSTMTTTEMGNKGGFIGIETTAAGTKRATSTSRTAEATTYHKTMTYSRTNMPVSPTATTGAGTRRVEEGLGAAAFALLVGIFGWVFAEL